MSADEKTERTVETSPEEEEKIAEATSIAAVACTEDPCKASLPVPSTTLFFETKLLRQGSDERGFEHFDVNENRRVRSCA
ncbi:hypothetical protein GEOBRER4_n3622 [Citrifermentans bremense]|uniref:Uncharacterized protein n=1 Tax=Citrifermentans bremense TaxID=60035 RepID=A0A6S6M4S4_9BACT|nr:hypothetical protein [Citrifermentans bremense]BCG48728.1 hypothetical protein GEOBRER4_n3622 [Citrifermentans bremense]